MTAAMIETVFDTHNGDDLAEYVDGLNRKAHDAGKPERFVAVRTLEYNANRVAKREQVVRTAKVWVIVRSAPVGS